MANTTLTFGRLYGRSITYEHSNQILHIPETQVDSTDGTTLTTFLNRYGFSGFEKISDLSVQIPLRVGDGGIGKTFDNLRIVIFNGFTGTIDNDVSSDTAWFSHSAYYPEIDNMLIKWNNEEKNIAGFIKSAIDAGNLIQTPLAYIDTSFTHTAGTGVYEQIATFNSTNATITITDAGKDINNWAPLGSSVANGYGLFIGFYNTATDSWSDDVALGAGGGLNWARYTNSDPYAYVTLTTSTSIVKYYNGTEWKDCEVYYHNGSEWKLCEIQYHDGSNWKPIG